MLGTLYLVCQLYLEHTVLSPHKGSPTVLCSKPKVRLNSCLIQEVQYGACPLFLGSCWEPLLGETHPALADSSRRTFRLNSSQELHSCSLKPYLIECVSSEFPDLALCLLTLATHCSLSLTSLSCCPSSVHLVFPGWHLHEGNKGVIRFWCQRVCLQGRVRE